MRGLTGFLKTILLTLFSTRVTGKVTCLFNGGTKLGLSHDKRTGNAVTNGACLTGITASVYVYENVVFVGSIGKNDGLTYDKFKGILREILGIIPSIDGDSSVSAGERRTRATAFLRRPVPQN